MSTFERYLFKKLLISLSAIVLVLLPIISGRLIIRLMDRVANNLYSIDVFAPLLVIGTLNSLVYILSFSALFAAIFVLRNCYYNNEITAAFSLRISRGSIYKTLMYFGVPLALFLLYTVMEIIPHFNEQYRIVKEKSQQNVGLRMIPSGQFITLDNGGVLFIERRKGETVEGVFLSNPDGSTVETAPSGKRTRGAHSNNTFTLEGGRIYQHEQEGVDERFSIFSYRDHHVWIPYEEVNFRYKPSMMSWTDLRKDNSDAAAAELQRRLAIPIHLLLLLLMAEPLGRTRPRHSNYLRPIVAIVIFLGYTNAVSFVARLVEDQRVAVYPGVWSVPITFAIITALYFAYQRKRGYL